MFEGGRTDYLFLICRLIGAEGMWEIATFICNTISFLSHLQMILLVPLLIIIELDYRMLLLDNASLLSWKSACLMILHCLFVCSVTASFIHVTC